MKRNGEALKNASKELKNDENFVIELVKSNSEAIKYASQTLLDNEKFLLNALHMNYESFYHFPEKFQCNLMMALEYYKLIINEKNIKKTFKMLNF